MIAQPKENEELKKEEEAILSQNEKLQSKKMELESVNEELESQNKVRGAKLNMVEKQLTEQRELIQNLQEKI